MQSRISVFFLLTLLGVLGGGLVVEASSKGQADYKDSEHVLEDLLPGLAKEKLTAYEARLLMHETLRKPRPNGKRLRDAMPEKKQRRQRASKTKQHRHHHSRDFLLE